MSFDKHGNRSPASTPSRSAVPRSSVRQIQESPESQKRSCETGGVSSRNSPYLFDLLIWLNGVYCHSASSFNAARMIGSASRAAHPTAPRARAASTLTTGSLFLNASTSAGPAGAALGPSTASASAAWEATSTLGSSSAFTSAGTDSEAADIITPSAYTAAQ